MLKIDLIEVNHGAASSLTLAHRKLTAVGCDSRLFLFDGLWHAFFADPELPESLEAYDLICRFFSECGALAPNATARSC